MRNGEPSAPSMELTLSKPWYVTSGNKVATTPNAAPPSGACHSRGTRRANRAELFAVSPLSSPRAPEAPPRSSAAKPRPMTAEELRNATAVAPQSSPRGRYSGSSARFFSSNAGTMNAGCSPSSAPDTTAASTEARMTLSVVSAPNPVLPPRSSTSTSPAAFPARRALAGCSTDSNAKNRPAMGAPKPAEMPAALPAATSPSRRDANRARRRLARRDSFAPAPSRSRSASVWLPKKPPEPPEEDVVASWRLPAIEAPISTLGPSGPSDAPAPRVTTAAAAFSAGRAAARAATVQDFGAAASDDASVCSADSDSCFVVFSEPHLGASSPSKPPARNRRPVTANPAAVGAATAPTACTHVSGRTSRMPSTRNRSGEYTVVVRNTRSCTPCSAMLNAPTPRPVSKPTPHATASKSVGLGSSGSSSRSRCRSFASFESSRSAR